MITYKIKKPYKPFNTVRKLMDGIHELVRPPQQQPVHHNRMMPTIRSTAPRVTEDVAAISFGEKHFYNSWLNGVMEKFPKGSYVTLRMYPIVVNRTTPMPVWQVEAFQEMRHLADWDATDHEPRAVYCRSQNNGRTAIFMSSKRLRKLTDEEIRFANLSNPKTQEPNVATPRQEPSDDNERFSG